MPGGIVRLWYEMVLVCAIVPFPRLLGMYMYTPTEAASAAAWHHRLLARCISAASGATKEHVECVGGNGMLRVELVAVNKRKVRLCTINIGSS